MSPAAALRGYAGGRPRLVIVETPGIGQGDAAIAPLVDVSLYVMTPEFGAASQLEKIDMLDFADAVAINKFERRGAEGAANRGRVPAPVIKGGMAGPGEGRELSRAPGQDHRVLCARRPDRHHGAHSRFAPRREQPESGWL